MKSPRTRRSTAKSHAALRSGGRLSTVLPIVDWLRTYDRRRWFQPDVLAGLTVAAFSVPESMAYASLAGWSRVPGRCHRQAMGPEPAFDQARTWLVIEPRRGP